MIDESRLTGFFASHAGMRAECARIAAAARQTTDRERVALLEEQLGLVLDVTHHHHTAEDELLWPMLLERAPEHRDDLQRLIDEHAAIEPALAAAGDASVPLRDRADALDALHALVNEHLDDEEKVAVPLMLRHLSEKENDALGKRALGDIGARRMPVVFGWFASGCDEQLRRAAVNDVPLVPRLLFRRFWWPSYLRRFEKLYGRPLEPATL